MKPFLLICFFCLSIMLHGQNPGLNLVPNANFHQKTNCPNIPNFTVLNWYQATDISSADYFNTCGNPVYGIPTNYLGEQTSDTGQAYVGLITWVLLTSFREYVEVALYQTLIQGACYEVSMFYNKSDVSGSSNNLGLLLSDGPQDEYIGQNPQIEISGPITDSVNWIEAKINYTANGTENTLTIGNFKSDAQTIADGGLFGNAYYYIDSVTVRYIGVQSDDVEVELGDDIYVCEDDLPVIIQSNDPFATNSWSDGSTAPFIAVNDPGIYYLIIYDGCEYGLDSVEVFIFEEPELELEDQAFCEGESVTFNLDPTLGDYLWNDGSTNPNYTITETGTYSVILTHDCDAILQTIEVEVSASIELPEIEDYYLCTSDLPLLIWLEDFNDGVNEFNWSSGSTESIIFITEPGEYSVDVSNDCFVDNATFEVFISDDLPDEITFIDTLICPGESVTINPGLADSDLVWDDGSMDSTFTTNEPGTYFLLASNYCEEKLYSFQIEETPLFSFELGPDLSICPGDSVLISSPIGEDLLWNNSIVSDEIWVKEEGVVTAAFSSTCNIATDSLVVLLNGQSPQIVLPDSLLLCPGDSILVSAGNSNGVDYTWNTGSFLNEIYITEAGVYDVIGTNSCGADMDTIVIIAGETLPPIVFDDLYIICPGDTLELMVEPGNAEITWNTGSQDSVIQITEVGDYNLFMVNSCFSGEVGFELQFEDTLATFDLGEDMSICSGESTEIQGPSSIDGTYLWNTTEDTESIQVTDAGVYFLEIEGICNTVVDSLTIIDLGVGPTVELGEDILMCEGDSVELVLSGSGINEIIWSTGDTTESIYLYDEGTYYIDVLNLCGTSTDSVSLVFNTEVAQIELGLNTQICEGDSILLDVGTQAGTITWNTGDEGQSIYVSQEAWYEATLSSSCGESSDSVYISTLAGPMDFDLGADTIICEGSSIEINLPALVGFDIEWQDGFDLITRTLDNDQIYWLIASNECGLVQDSISIDFHPSISPFSFDPVDDLCIGDTVILEGYQDNVESFTWQDNSSESSYVVTEAGFYNLLVEGICESFESGIEVDYIELEVFQPNINAFYTFCEGASLSLDLESSGVDEILWEDGSTDFERTFSEAGNYGFELFNFCQDSSYAFTVTFIDCISDMIYVPNTFTPNDDGTNDVFSIELPSDWVNPTLDVAIFNRWGEEMFYSEAVDFSWDGRFKDQPLNPGVYVYSINIEVEIDQKIKKILLQGDITIYK